MATLLLNADFTPLETSPLSVLEWKDSIRAYFTDNLYILKTHDNWVVRSPNTEYAVPSIVVSRYFMKKKEYARLGRKNLYIRDRYTCQYCNVQFHGHELTFDHVVPKASGGKSTWENMVASCRPCNNKKGHRVDISPLRKPYRPTYHEIYNQAKCYMLTIPDPAWQDYLNWPEHLLQVKLPI